MHNKYPVLLGLIMIIVGFSLALNYGYYKITEANPEIKYGVSQPKVVSKTVKTVSKATTADVGPIPIASPQLPQITEYPQLSVGPVSIPILMYHEIGDGPNSLYVADQDFAAQMRYLYDNGYRVVNLAQANEMLLKQEVSSQTVALTFDDGYLSFYTKVWPLLKEYDFGATVFVITDFIGNYNYISWDHIYQMSNCGIEIGSHSQSHPSLPVLNDAGLSKQTSGSKAILEQRGLTIESFCYPSGQYTTAVVNQVINSGYKVAVTTKFGIANANDSHYLLPRVRINRGTDLKSFEALIKQ